MRMVDHDTTIHAIFTVGFIETKTAVSIFRKKLRGRLSSETILFMARHKRDRRKVKSAQRKQTSNLKKLEEFSKGHKSELAVSEINRNLTISNNSVISWYVLSPKRWSFRSNMQREALLSSYADRLAALAGHNITIRVSYRPYPVIQWAKKLHKITPAPLPSRGNESWASFLINTQLHLHANSLSDKVVFLGVHLTKRRGFNKLFSNVSGKVSSFEIGKLSEHCSVIDEIVAGPGMEGRPATVGELEWLMHRSVAVGAPSPEKLSSVEEDLWEGSDLEAFTDAVAISPVGPLGDLLKVSTRKQEGSPTSHYVAVLTIGRMGDRNVPESSCDPWIQHSERLPFPVEWVANFSIMKGADAKRDVQQKLRIVRDMQQHYDEHDVDEPIVLERQAAHAKQIEDEMTQGGNIIASRAHGYIRLCVSGATEEECRKNARRAIEHYRSLSIDIAWPKGQVSLVKEFIPHENVVVKSHIRRMPVLYLASALPTVTASVGDRRGPYLGTTTSSSRRAVCFDTHYATEVKEASGLIPIVGALGSGKALSLDTPLPTPDGWTTMGKVQAGDLLFGENGLPTKVIAATDIMYNHQCYEIKFSDGTSIIADAGHQWKTREVNSRRRSRKYKSAVKEYESKNLIYGTDLCLCGCGNKAGLRTAHFRHGQPRTYIKGHSRKNKEPETFQKESLIRTTEDITHTLTFGPNGQHNHSIHVCSPLSLPERNLPIHPYMLGVWLGDGDSKQAKVTSYDEEMFGNLERTGHSIRLRSNIHHIGLLGVKKLLKEINVFGNKHIPIEYLRASEQQRRELLAGLLDTDGTVSKTGTIIFSSTSRNLAKDATELIRSLGYKPSIRMRQVKGRTIDSSTSYVISFTTTDKVLSITRKADRINENDRITNKYRYIVAVDKIDSVPVRCIQVDNSDGMFLAGRSMIPTHNSSLLGLITYASVKRGILTTILDPSGPLARLTELPDLKDFSSHLDLTKAPKGTLNPYSVIAIPTKKQFEESPEVLSLPHTIDRKAKLEELFTEAVIEAENDRKILATDVVRMLLPPKVDEMPETQLVIGDAVRAVGGYRTATLNQIIERLDTHEDRHGKIVANCLRDVRELPKARLFFPQGELGSSEESSPPSLLVMTMAGLTIPSKEIAREHWSTEERLAVPLLHLAAHLTARRIYGLGMAERKTIGLDEVGQMTEWASGRALFTRIGRDSRKWNTCALVSSQNPADILGMEVGNFIASAFVGRIEDEPTATEALRLLRVSTGVGYEQVLANLSAYSTNEKIGAREFIMRDVENRVERIRVDMTHLPLLMEALNTTATTVERADGEEMNWDA